MFSFIVITQGDDANKELNIVISAYIYHLITRTYARYIQIFNQKDLLVHLFNVTITRRSKRVSIKLKWKNREIIRIQCLLHVISFFFSLIFVAR